MPLPPRSKHRALTWRPTLEARALAGLTVVLIAFGLTVLYSASSLLAIHEGHASTYYLTRQLVGVAIGTVLAYGAAKIDAEHWARIAWPLMWTTLGLMLVVVLPFTTAIAPRVHGSRRWLNLGFAFQPSELAKLAVVMWTAMYAVTRGARLRRLTRGLLPCLAMVGSVAALAALEPDLSIAMTYVLMMGVILFAAGVRIGHFIALIILAIPVLWHELERLQYVLLRMATFLDPGKAPQQVGYQLRQSLIAVGSGGWFGVGLGRGQQQAGFLPFPYSDFIGSNIGEEWGLLGLAGVTLAFALYCWLGFRIARGARSRFQSLVAIGLTFITVLTAYLHIGVVIGLLPTTGLTLPFFSYGRTNLIVSLLTTGILTNIGSTRSRRCRTNRPA